MTHLRRLIEIRLLNTGAVNQDLHTHQLKQKQNGHQITRPGAGPGAAGVPDGAGGGC